MADLIDVIQEALKLDPAIVTTGADGFTTQRLTAPVTDESKDYTELRYRRCTAGDLLAVADAKNDVAKAQTLISRMTGLSPAGVSKLDGYDFLQANKVVVLP